MTTQRRFCFCLCVIAWLLPETALAQQLGGGTALDISIIRIAAALLFCAAVAVAAAVLLRNRPQVGKWFNLAGIAASLKTGRRIEVLEARRISSTAEMCLVRCDGTEYLILCGQSGLEVLTHRDQSPHDPSERMG